jgi:hypothetical protein
MNNAKYALIIATGKWPSRLHGDDRNYHTAINNVNTRSVPLKCVETLAENVWLIELKDGLQALSSILHEMVDWSIQTRVLFLDNKPDWAEYSPPQKT